MKKNLPLLASCILILVSCFLLLASASAQTNVSGFISANTIWTLAGSPYVVVSNALLSHGYTLTIDPGVVVKFNDSTALQIDGELHAIGTAANRITFTSNQIVPAAGDWAKIHFADTCVNAVFDVNGNYLSGCIMKYCDVMYGGQLGFGEIHVQSSSPYISQCNVQYSIADGIYCGGSSYLLDSSLVSNNTGYGLYFDQFSLFSCGLTINGDTIRNNTNGGLYLGWSSAICSTEIKNNFFVFNGTNGAIFDYYTLNNVFIHNNYFLNNTSNNKATIHFQSNSPVFHNIKIEENYFSNNNGFGIIYLVESSSNININKNYFVTNISQDGIIKSYQSLSQDTISCNHFLNNQTTNAVISLSTLYPYNAGIITNNIFNGNINSTPNGISILSIAQTNQLLDFSYNTIKNNTVVNGSMCYIKAFLNDSTHILKIHHNEFSNNNSHRVIHLDGSQINNANLDFLYMKHNNFLDVTSQFEIYNSIPYGSPNIYADSNYWNSTNIQHIDSVIYDYFDFANQSVVYYMPIAPARIDIDTICPPVIITSFEEYTFEESVNLPSILFPNPFTTHATIKFPIALHSATFRLYNLYGQLITETSGINGESFQLNRGTLGSGVYVYEVTEKGKKICGGKAVVY
ncbi:MAG TPA: T9SS type A sorting domain-containing protein [Bacteroidia bacterium]|nr:T9SS type A sorting domain-containing protein [Bacteroidia bacterium]